VLVYYDIPQVSCHQYSSPFAHLGTCSHCVYLGCYNKGDWMAYKQQDEFLTVLKAEKSTVMVPADSVSGEGPFSNS
jgi:hypothetical protein